MKICSYCDSPCEDSAKVCPACGANVVSDYKVKCGNCGHIFDRSAYCPNCGVKVGQKAKKCPRCGNEYYSNACPSCGYTGYSDDRARTGSQSGENIYRGPSPHETIFNNMQSGEYRSGSPSAGPRTVSPGAKNKWISLLLCLFLGVVGGHKFYEGKMLMGVIYLLTGGLFGIGAIIDFIVLLSKPNPYYLK